MTKEEARGIYEMASAISVDEKEVKRICKEKGLPDQWINEFIEEDNFFGPSAGSQKNR
jgi:hypothetical protein